MNKYERSKYNKATLGEPCGFICGQDRKPVADLKYGALNRSFEQTGCAPAAVYNALKLTGRETELCELLYAFEKLRMPWLFGLFGTKPLSLRRYFTQINIPYKNYYSIKHFKNAFTKDKVGIVCAWNKGFRGIHFFCVFSQDGKLKSMNRSYSDKALVFSFEELSPIRFIIGIII